MGETDLMPVNMNKYPLRGSVPGQLVPKNDLDTDMSLTPSRKIVEGAFYFILLVQVFPKQMHLPGGGFLAGALVSAVGALAFLAYWFEDEPYPTTLFFAIAINAAANFSQVIGNGDTPLLGSGLPELLHWTSHTLCLSFIVRNRNAETRACVALGLVLLAAVALGGIETTEFGRLELSDKIGGNFKNANSLAYTSGLVSVSLLFLTRRVRNSFRVPMLLIAALLVVVCIHTVSRGGMLSLSVGVLLFLLMTLSAQNKFRNLFLFVAAGLFVLVLFPNQLSQSVDSLLLRVEGHSEAKRVAVYTTDLLGDLGDTMLIGMGPEDAYTSAGVSAHNTFIYTHFTFGGPTAYVYLSWIFWIGFGVFKLVNSRRVSRETKLMVVALFGMMFISHMFSNKGFTFLSSVYAVALIEKYTVSFRRYILPRIF